MSVSRNSAKAVNRQGTIAYTVQSVMLNKEVSGLYCARVVQE